MTHHPPYSSTGYDTSAPPREPPHNIEAEQQLLGTILLNNRALERVSDFLRPEHFAHALHGRIFEACQKLIERGDVASVVSLRPVFDYDQTLAEAGGFAYIVRLVECVITTTNAAEYGRQILDLATRRRLIEIGQEMMEEAWTSDLEASARTVAEAAASAVDGLLQDGPVADRTQSMGTAAATAIAMAEAAYRGDGPRGITTGIVDLDRALNSGAVPGNLYLLGGRPSMGKSGLAVTIGLNAARAYRGRPSPTGGPDERVEGARVAMYLLEMPAEQVATRGLSMLSGVAHVPIETGQGLRGEDFAALMEAKAALDALPLTVEDTACRSLRAIRAHARRLKRRQGLDLIIIDYLQIMEAAGKAENRNQEVSAITRGLMHLARELDVAILLLSQLSRDLEKRDDKRPQLSDLRDSGSIEQDAFGVLFVYREQYYLERSEPSQKADESTEKWVSRRGAWEARLEAVHGTAEIIVAKLRQGRAPTTVRCAFDGAHGAKFSDLARYDDHTHDTTNQTSFGGL